MSVGSPMLLLVAIAAALAAVALLWPRRRLALLLAFAIFGAMAAAADVSVPLDHPPRVAVLVDASPSTRGMWFRDAAEVRRVAGRLAPGATLQFLTFAEGKTFTMVDAITESPTTRSVLPAVDADAVVLMSDGQLDTSTASTSIPIFPIVAAERTSDARIRSVTQENGATVLDVINDGPARTLTSPHEASTLVPPGSTRLTIPPTARSATLNPADPWPENDTVPLRASSDLAAERWWIGPSPPAGFRSIDPENFPPLDAWLAARAVVLNNVPAATLEAQAQQTLARYVRDLGGGLILVGGANAFSAGGYGGTEIDALSPLASEPPKPRRAWLILIDASGSMATRGEDGRTRLDAAINAARAASMSIPAADAVAVASFARELQAWPAREDRQLVPPAGLSANGPTNLRAALEAIVASRDDGNPLPLRVLALTDGDAELQDTSTLAAKMTVARVTVDWLALNGEKVAGRFAELVRASGGNTLAAGATSGWRDSAITAVRRVTTIPSRKQPLPITWRGKLASLRTMSVTDANRTFLREGATALASSSDDERFVTAAHWRVGTGEVAALGFAAPMSVVNPVAQLVESPPRDPRFRVRWNAERIAVEAATAEAALNGLHITTAEVGDAAGITLEQTAPGRYEGAVPSAGGGRIFATRADGQTIDLHATPALPAEEFREIGLDRPALEQLAARTGGNLIERDAATRMPPVFARRQRALTVPLLILAAASAAGALLPLPVRRARGPEAAGKL